MQKNYPQRVTVAPRAEHIDMANATGLYYCLQSQIRSPYQHSFATLPLCPCLAESIKFIINRQISCTAFEQEVQYFPGSIYWHPDP